MGIVLNPGQSGYRDRHSARSTIHKPTAHNVIEHLREKPAPVRESGGVCRLCAGPGL